MKKGLKIIIIVALVIATGIAVYFGWQYLNRDLSSPALENNVGIAGAGFGVPKQLSNDQVFDYWLNKTSGEIYYLKENGQIYKINSSGNIENTDPHTAVYKQRVIFSPRVFNNGLSGSMGHLVGRTYNK